MAQIKQQLEVVLRYGFWIGCTVVLLGSLGIWYMTTSRLKSELDSQTSKLTGDIQKVTSVRSELPEHPNPISHARLEEMIAEREREVLEAWNTVYERQRDILTWPVEDLSQEFVDEFKDLIPIEQYVSFPTDESQEKETTLLNQYSYYIGDVLPKIAKIANAEWTATFDPTSRGGGMSAAAGMTGGGMDDGYGGGFPMTGLGGAAARDDGPLVKWPQSSQDTLLSDLFPWRGKRPTTLEVYYSQENLWILKQLLQIIATVNGDARQRFQAKIREINRLAIGKSVKFGAGNVAAPGAGTGAGGEMMSGEEYMGGMDTDAMGMGGMGDGMMDAAMGGGGMVTEVDPADGRYVDTQNQPITGADLRAALSSSSPTDANLAVAKRVPVMMSLQMDQRAIPQLLAECGNAQLMVEVRQVRVLPKGATASSGMDGGMSGGMDEYASASGGGGYDMGMGGMNTPASQPREEFPLDMTVEIYGLIYIYNPPQKEKLGVEQVTADTVIDGTSMREGAEDAEATPAVDEPLPAPGAPDVPEPATQPAAPDAAAPDAAVPAPSPTQPAAPAAGADGATDSPAAPGTAAPGTAAPGTAAPADPTVAPVPVPGA